MTYCSRKEERREGYLLRIPLREWLPDPGFCELALECFYTGLHRRCRLFTEVSKYSGALWAGKVMWPSHPLQSWSIELVRTCWSRRLTTVLRWDMRPTCSSLPAACVPDLSPRCDHFLPVTLQFKGSMHVPFVLSVCVYPSILI